MYLRRPPLLATLLLTALLLPGCAPRAAGPDPSPQSGPELTPQQFVGLSDAEKRRYRSVVLRIPEAWGGKLMPFSAGPYPSILDNAVETGEIEAIMAKYNQSLFELEHPRVRVEFLNFDMWSPNFKSALAVSLAAGRAPAVYIARDLPQTIDQGMYADLTDLLRTWDQADRQPEDSIHQGTVNGRTFTIAGNELGATVIRYRKDWFREAGLFNERGEPGPRSDWTWENFRRIAKLLTDPARNRSGYVGQAGDFFRNQAYGLRLYVPDRTGTRTWRFNEDDPRLLESLIAARKMVRDEKCVSTSVSMGWFEWHSEFEAGRAAMISSFSPHIPSQSLEQPYLYGKDKPFRDTVGMAPPPSGPTGLNEFRAITNPFGFDPTMSPEQLRAAFDWTKSLFYGPIFSNTLRALVDRDRALGKPTTAYSQLLVTPYVPKDRVLTEPMEKIFPPDYLRLYAQLRQTHSPPLPREFGLQEPPTQELDDRVKRMYSEAIFGGETDPRALIHRTAEIVNTTMLDFRHPGDRERQQRFYAALGDFYRRYFPEFYRRDWPELYERYYRVD